MCLGEGFGVGFRQVGGGGFPVGNEEKGRGWARWGVGWGLANEPASQCALVCQNYPLVSCQIIMEVLFCPPLCCGGPPLISVILR